MYVVICVHIPTVKTRNTRVQDVSGNYLGKVWVQISIL